MRLLSYLNESPKLTKDKILAKIFDNCKPYLNLIGVKKLEDMYNSMPVFYRGDQTFNSDFKEMHVNPNRFPRGTIDSMFPIINKWLAANGHVTRDKCVIASSDLFHAEDFGNPGVIFPIGNIKYSFVKSVDFNDNDYEISGWDSFALIWHLRKELIKTTKRVIIVVYEGEEYLDNEALELISNSSINELKKLRVYVSSARYGSEDSDTVFQWESRAKNIQNSIISNKDILKAQKYKYEIWFRCDKYYLVNENIWI